MSARNNLSYTVVKSPADGVIGTLPYRVGALVSSNIAEPLTTVSDNSDMYVYFSMTENQLLGLIRQYGSKEEALKNMPTISLQLMISPIIRSRARSSLSVASSTVRRVLSACVPYSPIKRDCCIAVVPVMSYFPCRKPELS